MYVVVGDELCGVGLLLRVVRAELDVCGAVVCVDQDEDAGLVVVVVFVEVPGVVEVDGE